MLFYVHKANKELYTLWQPVYSNVWMSTEISSKVLNVGSSIEQDALIIQDIKIRFSCNFSTLHRGSCISLFLRTTWRSSVISEVQFTEQHKGFWKRKLYSFSDFHLFREDAFSASKEHNIIIKNLITICLHYYKIWYVIYSKSGMILNILICF